MVVYCGVEHQRTHWPVHSQTCMAYPLSMDMYNQPPADAAPNAQEQAPAQQQEAVETPAENMEPAAEQPQHIEEPQKEELCGNPAFASVGMTRPREPEVTAPVAAPPAKKRRTRKKVVETAPAPVVPPKEPTPEPKEQFIVETLWKSSLGMLVLREDKGYYGDGPNFDWRQGTKYLTDVKTKQTKGNKPVTEKWGKWCWDEKVYGPNNYGRFKIRIAANGESFKGTWGWGSRNRGGGPWTGTFVEETRIPIIPQEEEEEASADPMSMNVMDEQTGESPSQAELDVALCHAAVAGEPDKISSLIAQGANVNNRLVEKCTPVMHAVVMDYPNVVRALLKAPVDLNARDLQGCTPLHICAEHGHVECTKVILEAAGCDNLAESYMALMSHSHPLIDHPYILRRIAAFASPLDTSLTNDAGQTLFHLIETQAETAPALSQSRSQIADMVREYLANVASVFAAPENQEAADDKMEMPAVDEMYAEPPQPSEVAACDDDLAMPNIPAEVAPAEEMMEEADAEEETPTVAADAHHIGLMAPAGQGGVEGTAALSAPAAVLEEEQQQQSVPEIPDVPEIPEVPSVPEIPAIPKVPELPSLPMEGEGDAAKAAAAALELPSIGTVA